MALLRPAWMQATGGDAAITYSAAQDRRVLGALFSREGVLDKDAGHLKVSQRGAGANFSVDVAAGGAAIQGDDVSDQGIYQVASTATENRTTPSAPGSGTRNHRVIARIQDKMHNGIWTGYDWVIEIQQDTGSGTPALPASAIPLALVAIAAGQSSVTNANITDLRPRCSVGTPNLTGTLLEAGFNAVYGGRDSTRPLTFAKDADGWVKLAGWLRRTGGTDTTINSQVFWNFNGVVFADAQAIIPVEARPTGIRDVLMETSEGPMHLAIHPDGRCQQRYRDGQTLASGASGSWFSFDSITYRATPFS